MKNICGGNCNKNICSTDIRRNITKNAARLAKIDYDALFNIELNLLIVNFNYWLNFTFSNFC